MSGNRVNHKPTTVSVNFQTVLTDACVGRSNLRCVAGGYPDPNNCAVCRCPEGLGGVDCSFLQPSGGCPCPDHLGWPPANKTDGFQCVEESYTRPTPGRHSAAPPARTSTAIGGYPCPPGRASVSGSRTGSSPVRTGVRAMWRSSTS